MSVESDQQYFSRRYEEESAAADRAANREAQIAHLELAARYAQLAAAIREVDERIGASFIPSVWPSSGTTEHLARVIGT
jgi:hypothetical protein